MRVILTSACCGVRATLHDVTATTPEVDFALVLSRVIASAEDDPAQLRNIVYELARIKLQEEILRRSPSSNSPGTRDLSVALEFGSACLARRPRRAGPATF